VKMKKMMFLAAGLMCSMNAQAAGDPVAAKNLASICAACHGQRGISVNPSWPNLAGQKERYLVKALKDFRSGERKDPSMSPVARTLSDSDIDNLAAYFSEL